jgi:cytidylate kinase
MSANIAAEKESEVDRLVDKRLQEIGSTEEQVVIDSRLAWHWMPSSFKVYLDLDLLVAAERILKTIDPSRIDVEHIPESQSEYAAQLQQRLDSEARRYKSLYDANPYDSSNYDLVINTEVNNPEQVRALIIERYQLWLNEQ